jgi:hypothetical protein
MKLLWASVRSTERTGACPEPKCIRPTITLSVHSRVDPASPMAGKCLVPPLVAGSPRGARISCPTECSYIRKLIGDVDGRGYEFCRSWNVLATSAFAGRGHRVPRRLSDELRRRSAGRTGAAHPAVAAQQGWLLPRPQKCVTRVFVHKFGYPRIPSGVMRVAG